MAKKSAWSKCASVFRRACLPLALLLSTFAQNPPPPPMVDVELAIQTADGRPLADANAVIQVLGRYTPDQPSPDIAVRTDSQGIARFQAPVGAYRLLVESGGAVGTVGTTGFAPGKVARPWMPRMMAPGSIDGTYDPQSCQGDVVIHAKAGKPIEVRPTSPGHFHLTGRGGVDWTIWATASGQRCAELDPRILYVPPGRNVSGIVLAPRKPAASRPAKPVPPYTLRSFGGGSGKPSAWVKGTVRDTAGNPIANAAVMALGIYHGGIRMNQRAEQAVTDAAGHYEIIGEGDLAAFSATVLATVPGHPPAWAWPAFQQGPKPPVQDLIIPSQSGALNIKVLRQGQPVPGITVAIYLENANLRDVWARGLNDASAIQNAAYPMAKTGADGTVEFRNLLPGRYRVVASPKPDATRAWLRGDSALIYSTVQVTGIPVRVDQTTNHNLNLYEQQNRGRLQVRQPRGSLFTGVARDSYGPIDTIDWNSTLGFDRSGAAAIDFDHAGLWKVIVKFRDWPGDTLPDRQPYFHASGHLAISPNLQGNPPPILNARWLAPGSVRVHVEDSQGKPRQVTVHVYHDSDRFFGTTDEDGQIVFTGLTNGQKYYSLIWDDGPGAAAATNDSGRPRTAHPRPNLDPSQGPPPAPADLLAEPVNPRPEFTPQPNTETRINFRPTPVRYVYGKLRAAANLSQRPSVLGASNWATGEFVAGPFPPGDVQLTVSMPEVGEFQMPVHIDSRSNEAIRLDIDTRKHKFQPAQQSPAPDPISAQPAATTLGMGGISAQAGGASQLQGRVFLAGGLTPALGAQVIYWSPKQTAPSLFAITDALGNLQPRGLWRTAAGSTAPAGPGPDSATVIAFLPGSTGALVKTVTRLEDLSTMILPAPLSLTGRVTVGGASPLKRPGSILVLAAHQGAGFLDPYLSIATTADAQGNFELAGLTPGNYQVQAVLDNLWLSPVVTLKVKPNAANLPSLRLAIPHPGVPIHLQLRDQAGNPAPGATLTLARPGPLATLWPKSWTADSQGEITIPTLEAGPHQAQAAGHPNPIKFKVPPHPGAPLQIQIKLK
jgi:hypothetical protein